VWIDDTEPITRPEILTCDIPDENGFTSTRFTDNVMMTSSIFFAEIYRSLEISIFVPSHEYTVSEERESTEISLFIFLDRSLAFVDRFSF
jgi:hypothetical protein